MSVDSFIKGAFPLMSRTPFLISTLRNPVFCGITSSTFPEASCSETKTVYRFGISADQSSGRLTGILIFLSAAGFSTGIFVASTVLPCWSFNSMLAE